MVDKPTGNDRIDVLLAAYGSDVARWPAEDQAALDALSPAARRALLRDDAAMDALLADAATTAANAPTPDALMARILAAVPDRAAAASGEDSNAALEPLQTGDVVELHPVTRRRAETAPAVRRDRERAAVGALLAASLVLGIFVGSTEQGRDAAQSVGEVAGLSLSTTSVQMTALDEALQTQDDEELL